MKKLTISVALLLLVSASMYLVSCMAKEEPEAALNTDSAIPVKVVPAEETFTNEAIHASGMLASSSEARLSFKTGGIIKSIYVREGDAVRKGQLLASLDLTEIGSIQAQAAQGLEKAERDLRRAENLYRDSVATLEQYQNAATALKVAKEQMEIAGFNKNFSEIRATTDGRIVKKIMNEGEVAGPGMPVFFMNATGASDWLVKVGISDKDWARLKAGDPAKVYLDAYPSQILEASVAQLSQAPDPMSGLYQAELKLNTTRLPLATGLFARADITPAVSGKYCSVPVDALLEGNGNEAFVFVAQNNKAKRVPVKMAFLTNGKAMLQSGIEPGTPVITAGSAYLTDGVSIATVK